MDFITWLVAVTFKRVSECVQVCFSRPAPVKALSRACRSPTAMQHAIRQRESRLPSSARRSVYTYGAAASDHFNRLIVDENRRSHNFAPSVRPSAIWAGDFECNRDVSPING
jgi:hypothetical protein